MQGKKFIIKSEADNVREISKMLSLLDKILKKCIEVNCEPFQHLPK